MGGGRAKTWLKAVVRQKPQEGETHGSRQRYADLNTWRAIGTLAREEAQKPRLHEPAFRFKRLVYRAAKRYVGAAGAETRQRPCEHRAPKGKIPRAPPVRNKTGPGAEGVNRQEGDQTLQAERSGQAKPALSGPPLLACAEGNESP